MVADTIALILVIIGALNWGAMGLFGIDILSAIFGGSTSLIARIVYSLIGIAGLWSITILFKDKVPQDTRE
jgi:uncharacterized membrane protein YuzA (DUF378 family)